MIHSTKNNQFWLFWCQWWSEHQDQDFFFGNWILEAVQSSEIAGATEVNEAGEFSKAWKTITVDFRCYISTLWWQNQKTFNSYFKNLDRQEGSRF